MTPHDDGGKFGDQIIDACGIICIMVIVFAVIGALLASVAMHG